MIINKIGLNLVESLLPCEISELPNQPTLHSGHFDNLKYEDEKFRIWLSRMTIADGAPYNNEVTVEGLKQGRWETLYKFPLSFVT